MRKVASCSVVALVAVVLFAGWAFAAEGAGKGRPERRPGVALYKLKDTATPEQLAALNEVLFKHEMKTTRLLVRGRVQQSLAARMKAANEEALCAELLATGAVAFAEPDYRVAPVLIPNDPSYSSQWHHPKINSPGAWDKTTGSSSVLVAVLDTGIQSDHPDLAANLQLPGFNTVDNTTNTEPVHYHGTMVAGCVGAVGNNSRGVAGVAWTVKILPVRITNDPQGWAYYSDMTEGIRWAADQGAKVVNLSYGGAQSATIDSAAQYLRSKGGLLVMAAGNDGVNGDGTYPDFASFIAVGATTSSDTRASWSNYGTYIDVVAPGVSIYTTNTGSGYTSGSGTSFASPITAGLAALIFSIRPSSTPAEVESFIFTTCKDLGDPGEDGVYGNGRIDAQAAVAKAAGTPENKPPVAVIAAEPTSGVAPLTVRFDGTGSSDPDGTIVSYAWNFGDGSSGTGPTVTYTYTTAGSRDAKLTVTDNLGATATATTLIVVNPDPAKEMRVQRIDMSAVKTASGVVATAKVLVVNGNGVAVSGAKVSGKWSGAATSAVSATTGTDGIATLNSARSKKGGTFTFTVTDITKSGFTYNAAANVETSDSVTLTGGK